MSTKQRGDAPTSTLGTPDEDAEAERAARALSRLVARLADRARAGIAVDGASGQRWGDR